MTFMDLLKSAPADSEDLKKGGDVPALIRLMGHPDPTICRQAAEALGICGKSAVIPLLAALNSPNARIHLGTAETLGFIKDIRAIRPLIDLIHREKIIEVQWACVFALGEIGSMEAVPDLVPLLQHADKYIRYGAARALEKLGWQPSGETDRLFYLIALQDWESVKKYGPAAEIPLSVIFHDTDPSTRTSIITLLGEIGDRDVHTTCQTGLKDRDPRVRWAAVLASMNCGIKPIQIPPLVADRQHTGPDPVAAFLLNFLFLGLGYNYIGKWWGFPVFMAFMSILVLAQLYAGPFLPYLVAYPITAVLGVHTYYLAERMSDL